jgi:hypothetical protein
MLDLKQGAPLITCETDLPEKKGLGLVTNLKVLWIGATHPACLLVMITGAGSFYYLRLVLMPGLCAVSFIFTFCFLLYLLPLSWKDQQILWKVKYPNVFLKNRKFPTINTNIEPLISKIEKCYLIINDLLPDVRNTLNIEPELEKTLVLLHGITGDNIDENEKTITALEKKTSDLLESLGQMTINHRDFKRKEKTALRGMDDLEENSKLLKGSFDEVGL